MNGLITGLLLASLLQAPDTSPSAELDSWSTDDVARLFVKTNEAYEAGEFGVAASGYAELVARGYQHGHLYYNLGNAHLRNGELGRAIAAYLHCQSRLPRDQDVRANLSFARQSTKDAIAPPTPSAVVKTLFFWHYGLSWDELRWAAVGLNACLWLCLLLRFVGAARQSEVLRWSIMTFFCLLLLVGGSLAMRTLMPTRTAVILPQEVPVQVGTSADSLVRFKLHAGTEVRVLEQRAEWIRIVLPDGEQGWLDASQAELVEL